MTVSAFENHAARRFRKSGHFRVTLLASAAGIAALTLPQAALAQDAPPQASEEEAAGENIIIVTARQQNETLQDVPVTVTVIGGAELSDYNINRIQDVAARVPTLNVQAGGSGSGGQLSLRGIGSSNISASFDSAVALDFDGVVVSSMRLVQAGFFDVGQIEVLKGPQSLFFGKSASAGVLSIKSSDPSRSWTYGGKASYEFEEKGKLFNAFISGPISDTLGIRVAAQYNDIDAFIKLLPNSPSVKKPRSLEEFIGRVTLAWEPVESLRANLKFQYTRSRNDGGLAQSAISCGPNGRADEVYLLSGLVVIPSGNNCGAIGTGRYFLPDTAPPLAGPLPPLKRGKPSGAEGFNGVPFGKSDIYFGRLRLEGDLTDELTFTSITGYLDMYAQDVDNYATAAGIGPAFSVIRAPGTGPGGPNLAIPLLPNAAALFAVNRPGLALGTGTSDPVNALKQLTQELRLSSNFDGPFNFNLGAFYESREFVFNTAQQAVNISLIAADPVTGFTWDYRKIHRTKTTAKSVFASAAFDLSEQLQLSGGLRYTDEKKVNTISIPFVHAFLPAAAFLRSGFFSGPIRFKDNNFSPEVTLRYKPNDDLNIFASFKTGFKSGGIDNSALPSNSLLGFGSPDPAVRAATANALVYGSEKARGGEIGIKSQLADRALTLNATAYYYKFKDLQVQSFNATTIQFVTQNAGEVTQKGIDVEARYRTPLDGLTLSANATYLDAKFTKPFLPLGFDLEGRQVARAPKISGNLAFDYSAPIGDGFKLGLGGNVTYSGRFFANNGTAIDYVQRRFATLDGRISFGAENNAWQIALVGINLTDKITANTAGGRPFLAPPGQTAVPVGDDQIVTETRGRQIFLELSTKF